MSKRKGLGAGLICACVCTCAVSLHAAQAPTDLASRVDALIREGAVDAAVTLFDASADTTRTVDTTVLQRVARAVLSQAAAQSEDQTAGLEACLTLTDESRDPCEAALRLGASSAPITRLRALARQLRNGSPQADRQLTQLTENFGPQDWNAVIAISQDFPPVVAVALLARALAEGGDDVRYSALDALAAIDDPVALPLQKTWASRDVPGHLLALAAVARSGDTAALESITALLPELEGQDLLAAGLALAGRNDRRGFEALQQVLRGPEELLQLEAAAALAKLGDRAAYSRLESELSNQNPWIRLRALEKVRGIANAPSPIVWRQMTDPMPWIRVRAAQATLAACRAGRLPATK